MGRGNSTKQKSVKKAEPIGNGIGKGTEKPSNAPEYCLFKISETISLPLSYSSKVLLGDQVVFVPQPGSVTEVDIYVGTNNVGSYAGNKKKLLRNCMSKGYIYQGQVKGKKATSSQTTIIFEVEGSI